MSKRPSYIKDAAPAEGVVEQEDPQAVLAKELAAARIKKEQLEEELKDTNVLLDSLSKQLTDYMEARQIESFKLAGVGTFYIERRNYPNLVNKTEFIEWLDANGMGGMAQRTVHHQTLVGWVNERLKDGLGLPDSINNFIQPKVKFRKR